MVMLIMPYLTIAVLPTPRIAAFIPGQSPPAVKMPIFIPLLFLLTFNHFLVISKFSFSNGYCITWLVALHLSLLIVADWFHLSVF